MKNGHGIWDSDQPETRASNSQFQSFNMWAATLIVFGLVGLWGATVAQDSPYATSPSLLCEYTTLNSSQGTLADHIAPASGYIPYMSCSWTLSPPSNYTTVVFEFAHLDTEYLYGNHRPIFPSDCDKDFVQIYKNSSNTSVLSFSGTQKPSSPIVVSLNSSDQLSVTFTSDIDICGSGFNLNYWIDTCNPTCGTRGKCVNDTCSCFPGWEIGSAGSCSNRTCQNTNGCNGHGVCSVDTCICTPGWSGDDCSTPYSSGNYYLTAPSGTISSNQYAGTLNDHTIHIDVPSQDNTTTLTVFTFDRVDISGSSSLSLYDGSQKIASVGSVVKAVDRRTYTLYSNNITLSLTGSTNRVSFDGYSFDYETIFCHCSSTQGFCTVSGVCQCLPGWTGLNCTTVDAAPNGCWNAYNHSSSNTTCQCMNGWSGVDCSQCLGSQCSGGTYIQHTSTHPLTGCSNSMTTDENILVSAGSTCSRSQWSITTNKTSIVLLSSISQFITTRDSKGYYHNYQSTNIPPQVLNGASTITVTNSNNSTYNGQYFSISCLNNCSNKGTCLPNGDPQKISGSCSCAADYSGTDCSNNVCTNNCGDGKCFNNTCQCDQYWGSDCTQTYCSGLKTINVSDNLPHVIKDHYEGDSSRLSFSCSWNFDSIEVVSMVYTRLGLPQVGFLNIETAPQNVIRGSYGGLPLPANIPANSTLSFGTVGNVSPFTGFTATVQKLSACPNRCSQRGVCYLSTCSCNPGHHGNDCSQRIDINSLPVSYPNDTMYFVGVEMQWSFYVMDLSMYTGADMAMFEYQITSGRYPPILLFNPYENGIPDYTNNIGIRSGDYLADYISPGRFILGVFGPPNGQSTNISIQIIATCRNDCGAGICNLDDGTCICDVCYSGAVCDEYVCQMSTDNGFVKVLVVILVIIVVLIAIAFFVGISAILYRVWKRKQEQGGRRAPTQGSSSERLRHEMVQLDVIPAEDSDAERRPSLP
ncbi:hypothetical protein PROFUN_14371 [Planoprotostelium fungivorum]|uniref:Uncharacterized protein n=1 Tax=Planoprotostelium fungivorum TaxID=1890364 RepID=A0A2P6N0D8_9EUKA|nr:hypothetical protein PROFUN_14371 [Planoprotostelium fungivorum]